ncbi:MAG: IS4 family transposase [Candidatus Magasanikbacteria bacterium]|nr:IS4 family transposase [Candidatus Magasanikbacteria bacterium]
MNQDRYIFSQIVDLVSDYELNKCVQKYSGNKRIKNLDCRDQFLSLMFGQLTNLNSLRGIVLCLNAHPNALYHLGFKTKKFTLSTLSRANQFRDWRMWRDFTDHLIAKARKLYVNDNDFSIELENSVYVLDSTIIDLCLATFKWAYFELKKSAVKIHTQLDLKGNIPSFFLITKAKTHDVNFLDILEFEPDAIYIMDRGYLDFERMYTIHTQKAFFIVRAKDSLSAKRMYSNNVDKTTGLRFDQTIRLKHFYSYKHYPEKLRRVKYYDAETDTNYVYLTNNFIISAITVADLYRHRWQIELFFKWIKQHLKIQVFWGYSFNAVKTQICVAISTFLLVAIMKKQLHIKRNFYEILQIL